MSKWAKLLLLLLVLAALAGCGKDDGRVVYGGDMLKYSLCCEEGKTLGISCPVITNSKIDDISLNKCVVSEEGVLSVTMNKIDKEGMVEYGDYFVYFALLEVECIDYEKAVDAKVEKLIFDIDGEKVEYKTPDIRVRNSKYYVKKENCIIDDGSLFMNGDFTGIYGHIPDDESRTGIVLTSDSEVTFESYYVSEYLNLDKFAVNGKAADNKDINMTEEAGIDVYLEYGIGLAENVREDDIIKVSQIIIYQCAGQRYVWIYGPGIYIWKDYPDVGNIKRYIDAL